MLLANFNRKEHLRHRAVSLRQHGFLVLTRRCLIGTAPRYLAANSVPVSEMAQRRHLRSAAGHQLVVRSYCLNSCGLRAFSVLGLRLWNSLPRLLRDTSHNTTSFGHSLNFKDILSLGELVHTAH